MAINNRKAFLNNAEWTDSLKSELAQSVEARSQIKVTQKDIKPHIDCLIDVVNAINACDEYTLRCGGERLDDIMIPKFIVPFVYPIKVSLSPVPMAYDLVSRPKAKTDYEVDLAKIQKAAIVLAKTRKVVNVPMVSAVSARGELKMLSNVNFQIKGRTAQSGGETFIPVPLDIRLDPMLGEWSNADALDIMTLWISQKFEVVGEGSSVSNMKEE